MPSYEDPALLEQAKQLQVDVLEWVHDVAAAGLIRQLCPHGDPTCPCPDGLGCHYETYGDSPAWPCPHCDTRPA